MKKDRIRSTDLFKNLFRTELKLTYYHPEIRQYLAQIRLLEETKENIIQDESRTDADVKSEREGIDQKIKDVKSSLANAKKSIDIPEIELVFTKLNDDEMAECEEFVKKKTSEQIDIWKSRDRDVEIKRIKAMFDPSGIFSETATAGEGETTDTLRDRILDQVVNQILLSDGYSEIWATEVPDDDPELELTRDDLESLEADERIPKELQVEATLNYDERKQALIDEKRKRILAERSKQREERRTELKEKGFDALMEVLWNYKILSKSTQAASQLFDDAQIFFSVKDPKYPIYTMLGTSKQQQSYERFFGSDIDEKDPERYQKGIEEIVYVRENFEDFYEWLQRNYYELQQIRTREDVERIARSDLFLSYL